MKKWMKYIKPYLKYFILGPICMIVEVIGEVVMPKLLAVVINSANAGTLTVSTSLSTMVWMIVTAVAMMAGGVGGAYYSAKASVNFGADLRADLYSRIQTFSFSNIDKFSSASLVTRLTNDITQLQNFVAMLLRMALRAPGMMIAALVMAIAIKPSLSTVFAVTLPLMVIVLLLVSKKTLPLFKSMQGKVDRLNSTVQENVTNVRVVKSFVREDFGIQQFKDANADLKNSQFDAFRFLILMSPVMTLFMNVTTLSVLLIGGRIVLSNGMAVGDLSAFITYVTQILSSLMMVTILLIIGSRAMASAARVSEVLAEVPDISDRDAAYPEASVKEGTVEFRNVSFKYYKTGEDAVLNSISLTVPAGKTVGIIGSTGCGKTTLVSMIPRLYDPDGGEVFIDGINVKDYSLVNLRDGVGMVLQKNTLFSGTIAENLRWGDENASDDEISAVAEAAQAAKFIESFPEGYETGIEQGGTNVSGGQKQRLCIARALLKKPKILILDDSTSAVDTATERLIREAFRDSLKDSTKIIIAQRISSVMDADMIVVMNEGCITAVGNHEELLEKSEEYREIYESQTRSEKEEK